MLTSTRTLLQMIGLGEDEARLASESASTTRRPPVVPVSAVSADALLLLLLRVTATTAMVVVVVVLLLLRPPTGTAKAGGQIINLTPRFLYYVMRTKRLWQVFCLLAECVMIREEHGLTVELLDSLERRMTWSDVAFLLLDHHWANSGGEGVEGVLLEHLVRRQLQPFCEAHCLEVDAVLELYIDNLLAEEVSSFEEEETAAPPPHLPVGADRALRTPRRGWTEWRSHDPIRSATWRREETGLRCCFHTSATRTAARGVC
eukprot:GHVU01209040.1.p1 GENE.GHVU01209040.1~~GHVU01209040.1.p1  ORF type:complete len:260 (-),score=49.47 GHVU01209040.1:1139-1918(-)